MSFNLLPKALIAGFISTLPIPAALVPIPGADSSAATGSELQTAPPCLPPSNPFTLQITCSSAKLKWTPDTSALLYDVWYRLVGAPAWTKKKTAQNSGSKTVKGLNAGQVYEWKVRSICTTNPKTFSAWSPKVQFTTPAAAGTFSLGADTIINSNSNLFNGGSFFLGQRSQVVFSQAELLANCMTANSSIDTISIYIAQRSSTIPYSNFQLSYYYTTTGFGFPAAPTAWAPVVQAGGLLFGPVNVDLTTIPASGGWVHFPVNLVWNGSVGDLVLEFCWDNQVSTPSDLNHTTQTAGIRKVATVHGFGAAPAGCSLLPNGAAGTFRNANEYRPNIRFSFIP
jgi:hypothetical protein